VGREQAPHFVDAAPPDVREHGERRSGRSVGDHGGRAARKGELDGFAALAERWDADYGRLATAFREGETGVQPRVAANPCPRCAFKPLCRIGAARYEPDDDEDDAA
jgi:hypothetical protein